MDLTVVCHVVTAVCCLYTTSSTAPLSDHYHTAVTSHIIVTSSVFVTSSVTMTSSITVTSSVIMTSSVLVTSSVIVTSSGSVQTYRQTDEQIDRQTETHRHGGFQDVGHVVEQTAV